MLAEGRFFWQPDSKRMPARTLAANLVSTFIFQVSYGSTIVSGKLTGRLRRLFLQRQSKLEDSAARARRGEVYRPVMELHDFVGHGQANPRARLLRREIKIEDFFVDLGCSISSFMRHFDDDFGLAGSACVNFRLSSLAPGL